jgi:hypothetical protein
VVALFRLFGWILVIGHRIYSGGRGLFSDISARPEWETPVKASKPARQWGFLRIWFWVIFPIALVLHVYGFRLWLGYPPMYYFVVVTVGIWIWRGVKSLVKGEPDVPVNLLLPEDNLPRIAYTIKIPKETKWRHESALKFIEQLTFALPQLILRIEADTEGVRWQVVDPGLGIDLAVIEQMVRTLHAQAEVELEFVEPGNMATIEPFCRYLCYYEQPNFFVAPLAYVNDLKEVDPLASLHEI